VSVAEPFKVTVPLTEVSAVELVLPASVIVLAAPETIPLAAESVVL